MLLEFSAFDASQFPFPFSRRLDVGDLPSADDIRDAVPKFGRSEFLTLADDVSAFDERFNGCGAGRGGAKAYVFHRFTHFFVFDTLPAGLHIFKKRSVGVDRKGLVGFADDLGLGRRKDLPFLEFRKTAGRLVVIVPTFLLGRSVICFLRTEYALPAGFYEYASICLEKDPVAVQLGRCLVGDTVFSECLEHTAADKFPDLLFISFQGRGYVVRGKEGMMVGDLGVVDALFAEFLPGESRGSV